MRFSARAAALAEPSSVRPVRYFGFAVVAVALVAALSAARPARADEAALIPAPSPDVVVPAPSSTPAAPDAPAPDGADGADAADPVPLAPSEGSTATLADPTPALEGPLRPKGDAPSIAVGGHEDGWTRSFDRGVRWSKGDTSLGITAAPGAGVRLGATITR